MHLTYFVVQGYNCGKTVQMFHEQTDGRQLTDAVKFCTHTTKNQKLLFTYINAVVKAS